ncbi:ADP-ribosylation factor-binding protein GGA1-like isoform X2 [Sinocyclocheilus rhinocerous]|nr:PREDICTED: ADP-ribosylation factor-binding protein GGA1-like isoform X1 [Sinocyclocheilus rhinocerous]XP_016370407.1 PREDICTED: ADP-ribosylation factor-binding protein GGA1-like isoform X2 [Sinocyclocheilus rhinocerous]
MAAPPDEQSLESRINKATNPLNREADWESIQLFCDQLSNEPEGPQLATRLLAHKIQSPQEWEAMQALMVLETCVKNCGKRFHNEVGKFRFLNELIKVVSPKYLGSRAPEPVKKKVLEMMYRWTVCLPEETKISDAYQMLKKQGIIKQDPDLPDDKLCPPPLPRPKNAIFEDEEKSKMLSRLLNSSHPEDLRAANKLIKEMVQEDQKRMEKVSKRVNAIQEVKESVGLLTQLLGDYSKESGSHSNEELIKDLYQRCEKMRPTLFRLASDTEDNDEALAEILQANDSLTQVINLYRQLVKGEEVNGDTSSTTRLPGRSTALLDLTGLDTSPLAQSFSEFPSKTPFSQELGISLLDDELMSLGLTEVNSNLATSQPGDDMTWNTFQSSESVDAAVMSAPAVLLPEASATKTLVTVPVTSTNSLDELDLLGKTLLQQSLPPESLQVKWDKLQSQSKPTLRDLQIKSGTNTATTPSPVLTFCSEPGTLLNSQLPTGITPASAPQDDMSLVNVTVPLESIKPSSLLPVTIFDKHSLRVLFHFARDSPPARPDVLVVIISMLSSAPVPITNVRFQAAVPKTMRVKLQPPSGSDLPAFNPLLPPAAITQVLLLANPHKLPNCDSNIEEKVRLRYKLTFDLGQESHDESGDVEQFPPPESWGNL